MGWFKKKDGIASIQKAGTEAGELTEHEIKNPFILSRFHESGRITLPKDFFKDPYIIGFCIASIVFLADGFTAKRKIEMKEDEKQAFMLSAIGQLVGAEEVAGFLSNHRSMGDHSELAKGKKSGRALMISIAIPSAFTQAVDQTDPFVLEAVRLSKERELFVEEASALLSIQNVDAQSSALTIALRNVTIEAYINKTFLN